MDNEIELRVSDTEDREAVAFIQQHLSAYNIAAAHLEEWSALTALVRDDDGEIIAGLIAELWGGCLELRYLWVREDRRGHGYGTRLLAAAEAEARSRDCVQAVVDTFSFQAPDFYQRHGYTVRGIVDDFPRGFRRYVLSKPLG
jgi:GNAT superfamily N-acetyltransferase